MKNFNAKIKKRSDIYMEELIYKKAGTYSRKVISKGANRCKDINRAILQIRYAKQLN